MQVWLHMDDSNKCSELWSDKWEFMVDLLIFPARSQSAGPGGRSPRKTARQIVSSYGKTKEGPGGPGWKVQSDSGLVNSQAKPIQRHPRPSEIWPHIYIFLSILKRSMQYKRYIMNFFAHYSTFYFYFSTLSISLNISIFYTIILILYISLSHTISLFCSVILTYTFFCQATFDNIEMPKQ